MTSDGDEEMHSLLAVHRPGRMGLGVKLDKGFEEGSYCVYVEFDELAGRVGFGAARRMAGAYCNLLKEQLARSCGHAFGETQDHSRSDDPRRRCDLEATFLSFVVTTGDGRCHDDTIKEKFWLAFLRAAQAWDQSQAHVQGLRRQNRQERFREQLGRLLEGQAYADVGAAAKERLLGEVPGLAYPPRGVEP